MNAYYGYGRASADMGVMAAIAATAAVIGGIALFFTFLNEKNDKKFTGFLKALYEFLTFKKFLLSGFLKLLYVICFTFFTTFGILTLFVNPVAGLMTLIGGNISCRIAYELILVLLSIRENSAKIHDELVVMRIAKTKDCKKPKDVKETKENKETNE